MTRRTRNIYPEFPFWASTNVVVEVLPLFQNEFGRKSEHRPDRSIQVARFWP